MQPHTIWTIGHSTHPPETFVEILTSHSIQWVADVRRFPGSRRHPHFNRENLAAILKDVGIGYRHFPELGGRRSKRTADSPNKAWRVQAFNAYADHLQTEEGRLALEELKHLATQQPTVFMCSEALPWQCHRRLIADALVAIDWTVIDIYTAKKATAHMLTEFAKVVHGQVTYPDLLAGK